MWVWLASFEHFPRWVWSQQKQQLAIRDYDNCFVGGYFMEVLTVGIPFNEAGSQNGMSSLPLGGYSGEKWSARNSPKTNVKTELGNPGRVDSNVSKRSYPLCHFLIRFSRRGCHWNQHWNKERSDFDRVGSRRKSPLSSVGLVYLPTWMVYFCGKCR